MSFKEDPRFNLLGDYGSLRTRTGSGTEALNL